MDDATKPKETASGPAAPPSQGPAAKRAYSKPVLIDYGSVSELTRGGAGTTSDFRGSKKRVNP